MYSWRPICVLSLSMSGRASQRRHVTSEHYFHHPSAIPSMAAIFLRSALIEQRRVLRSRRKSHRFCALFVARPKPTVKMRGRDGAEDGQFEPDYQYRCENIPQFSTARPRHSRSRGKAEITSLFPPMEKAPASWGSLAARFWNFANKERRTRAGADKGSECVTITG